MIRSCPRAGCVGLAAVLLVWAAQPAMAQRTTLPAAVVRVSKEPAIIASQLRLALASGKRALVGLQAAGELGSLDESVQAARDAYVLIRSARAGMEGLKRKQKLPDPMLDILYARTTRAWNLARTPADRITWGLSRAKYLELSIRDLNEAMTILEQVVEMWP